ncbi:MAG TPA: hypothetical protein VGL08_19505, partial [Paraburkholderia sp.]
MSRVPRCSANTDLPSGIYPAMLFPALQSTADSRRYTEQWSQRINLEAGARWETGSTRLYPPVGHILGW